MIIHPIQMMIIGAQKAGTSSLLRYIAQHPEICTHNQREFHYFADDLEYAKGYSSAFRRYFKWEQLDGQVLLAKNAGLMYLSEAMRRVRDHNPDIHLVLSLRHPVDRAYSAYWFARRRGLEDLDTFEAAIKADPSRFGNDLSKQRLCAYLEKSVYVKYLIELFGLFHKEQIHVFLLEDIKQDPIGVCQTLYRLYDEIDSAFTPQTDRRHNVAAQARSEALARLMWSKETFSGFKYMLRRILPGWVVDRIRKALVHINQKDFVPPPMNPETRIELINYFKPFNAQLSELLGRDLSHWDVL